MNLEQVWGLVNSKDVGGEKGRDEVIRVLNRVWREEAASHSCNAKDLGRILSALDAGDFSLIGSNDFIFLEYGLSQAGFDELIKLIE
jgi:hypothetical protein